MNRTGHDSDDSLNVACAFEIHCLYFKKWLWTTQNRSLLPLSKLKILNISNLPWIFFVVTEELRERIIDIPRGIGSQ
jgi:hypothetical protein